MRLQGRIVALRAVEPRDVDLLYGWENDVEIWAVSGTTEPFSRAQIEQFVERQLAGADLLRTGQLRLMIDVRQADGLSRADGAAENENGSMSGNVSGGVSGGGGFRTVGAVDLFEYDPLNGRAGLGILIYGEENRRRGYASDTLEILCRYAREQLRLHQLWCTVGAGNAASLALFRQAGFVETGVRRDWLWSPEGFRDEILLQKILDI
ncbi:MAG TPA: GNAT family N-acetyltransferase [Candidatus Alistipes faecavium]|nr:GNAT family N-acetyltransferase [Candidatus Alistipes faecavium]